METTWKDGDWEAPDDGGDCTIHRLFLESTAIAVVEEEEPVLPAAVRLTKGTMVVTSFTVEILRIWLLP